jgi:hypothetical protein
MGGNRGNGGVRWFAAASASLQWRKRGFGGGIGAAVTEVPVWVARSSGSRVAA